MRFWKKIALTNISNSAQLRLVQFTVAVQFFPNRTLVHVITYTNPVQFQSQSGTISKSTSCIFEVDLCNFKVEPVNLSEPT